MEKDFSWPVRVYYEDTDAAGVVYHSQYLNYMERARTEWLRALGFEQERVAQETGRRFVVTRMEIDFLSPARLDDALLVTVNLSNRRRASLEMKQTIIRVADERLLIRGKARVACIDARLRPARFPPDFSNCITANESHG